MSDSIFSIRINNPLTIEEQLAERAHNAKFITIWFDEIGRLNMFTSDTVTYLEKLLVMDTIRQGIDKEMREDE